MENITIPNDEPAVQSTAVDENATAEVQFRTVCGITFTAPDSITDDTIISYNEKIQNLTRIETHGLIKKLQDEFKTCDALENYLKSSQATVENIQSMVDNLNTCFEDSAFENNKISEDEYTDDEIPDFNKLKQELYEYRCCVDIAMMLVKKHSEELEAKGYTSIADDITETLLKNRDTLNMSEDINSGLYVKYIDRILDEIKTGYIHADRMWPKLENKKRLLDIAKEFYKDRRKAEREIYSIGFRKSFVDDFISFLCMWQPQEFRDCLADDTVWLYFYHITKIVKSELKKGNYLSLVYKCYILQVLELYNTAKVANVKYDDKTELGTLVRHVKDTYFNITRQYFYGYDKYSK